MDNGIQIIIKKLDDFIKKYYFNKIIKGLILSLSVYAIWYLIVVIAEYFGRFSIAFRTVLITVTGIVFLIIFIKMILVPVLNLFKVGKVIDYKQASQILGKHFPEIADKLQNTLELNELADGDEELQDLIIASINQRTINLAPIPFVSAIDLKNNLKYLKYLVPSILIIVLLFIFWPSVISDATERIINYNKYYEAPAPFKFIVENDSLIVKKGQDFTVRVKTEGSIVPDQILLKYAGNDFFMEKESVGYFKYTFKNLNNNIRFSLSAAGIESRTYDIEVLPAPVIIDFKVYIEPPKYTGISSETYNNSGDISVPIGANVSWIFNTSNIHEMTVIFDSIKVEAEKNESQYNVKRQIMRSGTYTMNVKNDFFNENTGIKYQISVIPDLYPVISVKDLRDSTQLSIVYFNGFIDDDYGFSSLAFYCIPGEKSDTLIKIDVPFSKTLTSQDFYFAFDFASIETRGKNISYYFEVADNDGVNGVKKSKTRIMEFVIPSTSDIQRMGEEANRDTEEKIEEAKNLSMQLRKDVENLQKKLINEQVSGWERNQMMQQIMENQSRLENLVQDISKSQDQVQQYREQFSKNEEILKKQEEINKLFDSLMDEEMRKLMEELQKLMQNFNQNEFFKLADNIKFSVEEMEKQMDNTIDLLKKAEVEERLKNSIDQLKELAEDHQKLSEETKNKDLLQEDLLKKQNEQREEFNKLKEEYEKTLELNSELKDSYKLDDLEKEMQEISDMMEQGGQELKDGKNSKASKTQEKASEKMKSMSEKIENTLAEESMGQMGENIDDIRQVLENLISFSFEQEEILVELKGLSARDPKYKEYMIRQKNAKDNFDIIRDSLNSMASRIPMLGAIISADISKIYKNLNIVMEEIGDNRRNRIEASQQLVMTCANNLALLLLEMMEQMQQDMANQQSKNGGKPSNSCKNPGDGEGQMGKLRDMQKGMKQQMQDMINQMKEGGDKPGGNKSEQLARMLQQQEMMQQMLNDMMNGGINPESAKMLNQINRMMEENVKDIIGGNVTPKTINRQDQILNRMLQAENSEREREIDNKRKSNEAKDYKISNPEQAFKDKEQEIRFNELLQMSNLKLNSFYKNKYKEYLKKLGQD